MKPPFIINVSGLPLEKTYKIWEPLAYDCTFYTCHVPCKCFPLWERNAWFRLLILFYVDLWKKWSRFLSLIISSITSTDITAHTLNVKNFDWRTWRKIFLEAIFWSFFTKFSSSFYEISLAKKIFYFLSANHSPELWCVICNGVTLLQLMLHLNCSALLVLLRCLKTVSSTFQDIDFDGSLLPLFITWRKKKKTGQSLVNTLVLFSWQYRLP